MDAKEYRVRIEAFRNAARADRGAAAESGAFAGVVRNGRLPRSRAERLVVLGQLAGLFEPDHRYPEAEVNSRLQVVNPDYVLVRRYLVDRGFLKRANEVGANGHTVMVYWRADRQALKTEQVWGVR